MILILSHCGEYPCKSKHLIFAGNSPEMIRLARRITETNEALQMVTSQMHANFLRILANFLRSLRLHNNQFADCIVNLLRLLRIPTNALANFANACERLTNETTTQRMRGETPCQCFVVSLLFARLS